MSKAARRLIDTDAVTFEVVRGGLYAICEEMKSVIMRTSFSPLLSLSADLSCAILDAEGAVAAQGNDIPVHLGAMPFTGRAALEAFPAATWRPGDAVLLNDPYRGGTHLPDMSLVSAVFVADALVGFVANRVHWPDVGGVAAGSSSVTDDILKEGIRVPPVKIIEAGRVREDILGLILANVRVPEDRRGDFHAQCAGNGRGIERLQALCARYGVDVVRDVLAESQRYSRIHVEKRLAALPDAEVRHEESLDGDGYPSGESDPPVVRVRIVKRGARFTVDFSGSSPAARGPINAPLPVTASAVYYTLVAFVGGDIPPNSGAYAAVELFAPEGSVVHAVYPAPVVAANTETSNRLVDILLAALAKAYPDQVPAGSYGSACVYTLGGPDPVRGRSFVHYETIGGGMGATRAHDGPSGLRVHMGNTMNLPMEAIEAAMPLRFHAYEIVRGTGGAGARAGGCAVRKVVEALGDRMEASVLGERTRTPAHGVAGGEAGACARFVLHRADGTSETLSAKSGPHLLARGDRLEMQTAGGGGWGAPGAAANPEGEQ